VMFYSLQNKHDFQPEMARLQKRLSKKTTTTTTTTITTTSVNIP